MRLPEDWSVQSKDSRMKQAVIQFAIQFVIKVRQIIGIRPVSTSGCRITEVSVAWDHVAKVRLLLLRPNMSLWRNRHTQAVQSRFIPGSNPGRGTRTPGVGTGIRSALKMRRLRVRIPPGRPNVIYVRVTELA